MRFAWQAVKAARNLAKHGISFEEASSAFGDPLATTVPDPDHSAREERLLTTSISSRQRVVVVWHSEEDDTIRIIGRPRGDAP
jgi:uncharacterized DUF497 family protein